MDMGGNPSRYFKLNYQNFDDNVRKKLENIGYIVTNSEQIRFRWAVLDIMDRTIELLDCALPDDITEVSLNVIDVATQLNKKLLAEAG